MIRLIIVFGLIGGFTLIGSAFSSNIKNKKIKIVLILVSIALLIISLVAGMYEDKITREQQQKDIHECWGKYKPDYAKARECLKFKEELR